MNTQLVTTSLKNRELAWSKLCVISEIEEEGKKKKVKAWDKPWKLVTRGICKNFNKIYEEHNKSFHNENRYPSLQLAKVRNNRRLQ